MNEFDSHNTECKVEFRDGRVCCEIHGGPKPFPAGYYEEDEEIRYSCGRMNELTVPVEELPDDTLNFIYRKVKKTNNSIARDNGERRHTDLVEALEEEIEDRGLNIPNTDLTHRVVMQKYQSLDSTVPAIIKIGSAVGQYEFGTPPKEVVWEVLTTEDEAQHLEDKYEDVEVEEV